jgi:hypothetical protein
MPRAPTYTPREQPVIDAPDTYLVRVYLGPGMGWWEKDVRDIEAGDPLEVARRFTREFKEANHGRGVLCYAMKTIDGEKRIASLDTSEW